MNKKEVIVVVGTFDSKHDEFLYLYKTLKRLGNEIVTVNTGIFEREIRFPVTYNNDIVARAGGEDIESLISKNDRGHAIEIMSLGASKIMDDILSEYDVKGVINMGGGGGTYIGISSFQKVPFSVPKVCLSTMATKDLSDIIGGLNVILIPTIVDLSGLNSIIIPMIRVAVEIISNLKKASFDESSVQKKRIAISMFGNTTQCVSYCVQILENKGFEVFTFHANGAGGKTMEKLIEAKYFDGVLDVTTTELADELYGGVCSAGGDRLTAAAVNGVPQIVVPGCLDMVNFGSIGTVPKKYLNRLLYQWAPNVTLLRTNQEENAELGELLAEKVNLSYKFASVVVPLKGISQIDDEKGVFYNPECNKILFSSIKNNLDHRIGYYEFDGHINDVDFAKFICDEIIDVVELCS